MFGWSASLRNLLTTRSLAAFAPVALIGLSLSACQQREPSAPAAASTSVSTSPSLAAASPRYDEPYRPQFHFTPPTGWMNDPNGLVYFDGEYHLFYQYYPDATVWGPMHWAHAVSTDLLHWQHLPIALAPDDKGYIFSGSAVIDWHNTSGFGDGTTPPMVAIFTYHDPARAKQQTHDHESQGLAYSLDRGRNWQKFAGNPVLPNPGNLHDFRDPKVFWHEPSKRWVMSLSAHDHVRFYGSPNLKDWTYLSDFGQGIGAHGGVWECPDLFPIKVEGRDETRWVLILNLNPGGPQGGSGTQYFVGDFDGERFALDPEFAETLATEPAVWLDHGRDNYAGVTWSDVPANDGRRLFIGWMSNWDYAQQVPTDPWRSAMTVPRQLTLHKDGNAYRVHSQPVAGLTDLRGQRQVLAARSLESDMLLAESANLVPFELHLKIDPGPATSDGFALTLGNARERYTLRYDAAQSRFISDRREAGRSDFSDSFAGQHAAPRTSASRELELRVLVDVASIEVFADGGATVMTETFFPQSPYTRLSLSGAGDGRLVEGALYPLKGTRPEH